MAAALPGRPVAALDELPGRWPTDLFVVGDFHRWLGPVVWGDADALLFAVRAGSERHALVGVGEPAALAAVLDDAVASGLRRPDGTTVLDAGGPVSASLTRGAWDRSSDDVRRRLALPGATHWDWLVADVPPPYVDGEQDVRELDPDVEADDIRRLHDAALPSTFFPVDREGARWFGSRGDDGELRAVAGAAGWDHTVQLGGIATAPGCRGRGLGSAVTAAAARAGTTATGRASLALYADNAVAYRVYRRLGFRLHQPVETRRPA
ncbi:GNAT family N-acetyltransferase [Georgenia sp. MJ170]|uniref:GNAT family N-acetyltransferase n=1 Tax=Georgenia sunbinii TaxID=3117728 RepID=UPI002F260879